MCAAAACSEVAVVLGDLLLQSSDALLQALQFLLHFLCSYATRERASRGSALGERLRLQLLGRAAQLRCGRVVGENAVLLVTDRAEQLLRRERVVIAMCGIKRRGVDCEFP